MKSKGKSVTEEEKLEKLQHLEMEQGTSEESGGQRRGKFKNAFSWMTMKTQPVRYGTQLEQSWGGDAEKRKDGQLASVLNQCSHHQNLGKAARNKLKAAEGKK